MSVAGVQFELWKGVWILAGARPGLDAIVFFDTMVSTDQRPCFFQISFDKVL